MKDQHMTDDVLERFARGDLDDAGLNEVLEHLDHCEACARAGENQVAGDLAALREEWKSEPVEDRPSQMGWTFAAAAAIAIAVFAALLPRDARVDEPSSRRVVEPSKTRPLDPSTTRTLPPQTATVAEERYADPEWRRAVSRALESGRLPFPADLDELRGPADIVRGGTGADEPVSPAGIVIDNARPAFTWPAREGGTYKVFVFDDLRKVMESPPLQRTRWVPARDLPRGRTLTWQVEVTGAGALETIPSPPSPAAMFRIVTEEEHREVLRARESHPDDPLLLAVLYARSGMRAEALAALKRAAARDEGAQRIFDHETSTAQ